MGFSLKKRLAVVFASAVLAGCGGMSEQEQQEAAIELAKGREYQRTVDEAYFRENGFEIVGVQNRLWGEYDGWGHERGTSWQSEDVTYTLKKIPDNGYTYSATLDHRQGRVDYMYDLKCIDCIGTPKR